MSAPLTLNSDDIRNETARRAAVLAHIAEAINLPSERVSLHSNLVDDLGADSLAFLDIVFRIEQLFGIEISRGEIERAARGTMTDEEFAPDGIVSEAGLARLRELLPEGAGKIQPGLRAQHVLTLFTAESFCKIAEAKLREAGRL